MVQSGIFCLQRCYVAKNGSQFWQPFAVYSIFVFSNGLYWQLRLIDIDDGKWEIGDIPVRTTTGSKESPVQQQHQLFLLGVLAHLQGVATTWNCQQQDDTCPYEATGYLRQRWLLNSKIRGKSFQHSMELKHHVGANFIDVYRCSTRHFHENLICLLCCS